MKYILPDLPYSYDALEPYIDEKTMKLHHLEHHRGYVDKLNAALEGYPDLQKPIEELLGSLNSLPIEIATEVRNQGGGHANHTLFWTLLTPKHRENPTGNFNEKINSVFGGFSEFKKKFTKVANHHFASGWAWLAADSSGNLRIFSTKDHDSPITQGLTPLLVLDLWEHAHYLKYQNRRPEFVEAFWHIVNWREVEARWDDFLQNGGTNREWRLAS